MNKFIFLSGKKGGFNNEFFFSRICTKQPQTIFFPNTSSRDYAG